MRGLDERSDGAAERVGHLLKAQTGPRCPNDNHGRAHVVVRYCPNCGDVVNVNIPLKQCDGDAHAKRRRKRQCYCVDCGNRLMA